MDFEWDEAKRTSNLEKHGLDFDDVRRLFEALFLRARSDRDGEARYLAIGPLDGRILAVAYTLRGTAIRLISARSARPYEKNAYHQFRT